MNDSIVEWKERVVSKGLEILKVNRGMSGSAVRRKRKEQEWEGFGDRAAAQN